MEFCKICTSNSANQKGEMKVYYCKGSSVIFKMIYYHLKAYCHQLEMGRIISKLTSKQNCFNSLGHKKRQNKHSLNIPIRKKGREQIQNDTFRPTKQKSPTIAIVTLIINKQTKHPIKIQSLSDWITKRNTQLNAAYMKYTSNVNKNWLKVKKWKYILYQP